MSDGLAIPYESLERPALRQHRPRWVAAFGSNSEAFTTLQDKAVKAAGLED